MDRQYYVYILTNCSHSVLYVGVTNDLRRRTMQHRAGEGGVFTRKYKVGKLVYFERFNHVVSAIAREKQIKAGSRAKKLALIESLNCEWKDLLDERSGG